MVKWNSRHMTSFGVETGHHLPRSAFSTNKFRWIWLVFQGPHGGLLFCFELMRIDPWFVSCDDLINVFWSTAIVFCNISIHQSTRGCFERLSNCAESNENKYFLRSAVHAIFNVCCWKKSPKMPLSRGMSHGDLALSVHSSHSINVLWHNGSFWRTFTDLVF